VIVTDWSTGASSAYSAVAVHSPPATVASAETGVPSASTILMVESSVPVPVKTTSRDATVVPF
jgi:hypothetical protein